MDLIIFCYKFVFWNYVIDVGISVWNRNVDEVFVICGRDIGFGKDWVLYYVVIGVVWK